MISVNTIRPTSRTIRPRLTRSENLITFTFWPFLRGIDVFMGFSKRLYWLVWAKGRVISTCFDVLKKQYPKGYDWKQNTLRMLNDFLTGESWLLSTHSPWEPHQWSVFLTSHARANDITVLSRWRLPRNEPTRIAKAWRFERTPTTSNCSFVTFIFLFLKMGS